MSRQKIAENTITLNFITSTEQANAFRLLCTDDGRTMSDVLREYVARHNRVRIQRLRQLRREQVAAPQHQQHVHDEEDI